MSSSKKIIAIIPARGGSKGFERKNLRRFLDRPLLAHTIAQALASRSVSATYVSTDDAGIAGVAREYGAEVVVRPAALSGDAATSESALLHTLDHLQRQQTPVPDYVVFLQCTSPLRKPDDIDLAVEQIIAEDADSLFSAVRSHQFFWRRKQGELSAVNYDYRNRPRRQTFGEQFVENGSIYISKPGILRRRNNRLGGKITVYAMESWQAFEIDSFADFKLCQWLYRQHLLPAQVKIVKEDVQLIVYDFDGVMTDNHAYVDQEGVEIVRVNRSDGLAVSKMKREHIPQLILTSEQNPVVQRRAEKLGIPVYFGVSDKKDFLRQYAQQRNIDLSKVIYIGNDTNDLEAMKLVGFPIAPADGHREVKEVAKLTTRARGGEGVVRELFDLIVRN